MKETPRLGRGLASLFSDAINPQAPSGAARTAPVNDLEPNPYQPRGSISDDEVRGLANSILEQGILQPVLVRVHPTQPTKLQIIAGERRWRAARLAGLSEIPCFVRDLSDAAASAAALVENLQRVDLNPVEEAAGYKRLLEDFDLTQEQLSTAIGKSRSHIANTIRLLQLPPAVLDYVRSGTLSAGHARAALASADPGRAAQRMVDDGLNVRQAEKLASDPPTRAQTDKRKPSRLERGSADLRAVEDDLSEQLGLKVAISFNGHGGNITLRYETLDQLDHLVAKLGRP